MGSSSSSSFKTSGYQYYTHSSWVDTDELATVTLRSKRVKMAIGLGVHHAIAA